jgi:hypothetical protein
MKKISNWIFAAIAGGALLLSVPSSAKGQVAFGGTFRGPHGQFSIGIGNPAFPVGGYVPFPYARQVYLNPDYGYGFYYDSQWIPCEPYGSRWVVIERPVVYGRGYAYRNRGFAFRDRGDLYRRDGRSFRRDRDRNFRFDRRSHDNGRQRNGWR